MAINLKFDFMGNPEPPSIILANRSGNKFGQLDVDVESIDVAGKFSAASEFSFTLNKYKDGRLAPLWNKVVDFKLVHCPEWDMWFEIKVELDEATETIKTVFCTQLGQAELSQIKVYNIHINEEGDPNWDANNETYKSTILYDKENTDISLLHRLLKDKAPHYSIAYVSPTIQRMQRSFSFDDTSICDAFDEIAEEIGCLFVYNSNSINGGIPNRTISVYDLQQKCNSCGHRGEFTDKCPKCDSNDITYGYGEDTSIFVTSDELATEGIQLVTDTDSVKNCFKLEGGDDLMTATIRNCNPNGSDYIWYFSDAVKEDMSKELVEKLESYDEKYQEYYNSHESKLNETFINKYNALVNKYKEYYNTPSTCLNCNNEGFFEKKCTNCNSENILIGKTLQTIPSTIIGYPNLMTAYYNTIDLLLYLESGLMPNVEMSDTSAEDQIKLLSSTSLSPVAVNVEDIKNASEPTAKSAVLSMAKVLIRPTYKIDVVDGSSSLSAYDSNSEYRTWTGKFIITNYSDENDSVTSDTISVRVNNDTETFIKQKLEKALNKENTDDYSITGLFANEYADFCKEIKKYALNPLDNFSKACDTCLSILTEQGASDKDKNPDLYENLYKPYFDKQQTINEEIKTRKEEITIIEGVWDKSDENNPKCTTNGLQQYIEECQKNIQKELDFESYLGENLLLEFCAYRREDKYSNSNYISDGLNNAELFEKANEFIKVAEEEIFKSAELQHSISATLNNLLSLPKFKPLLKYFKTGNWIRVQVDDKVYKLRLLEYGFNYGNSKSISVEFSDVTKIKNGITDVKEVLEQASSMASSYDSVQRQAKKGDVARSTIDQWIVDGLDSANIEIKNNNNEEVLLTKNGLLARSYDDITGTYAPEQFKLTHNIMAYTTDCWETVTSALGKHKYKKWDGSNFVDDEDYGLTSKFLSAGNITGSQIISGEIVSSNYKPNKNGTYFDLNKGNFEIAGGKIAYNATTDIVTLDGVTIVWDDGSGNATNAPTISNIDGLSDALDKLGNLSDDAEQSAKDYADSQDEALSTNLTTAYKNYTDSEISKFDVAVSTYLGLGGKTVFGDNYIISPYIGGGYLNIAKTDNASRVIIDPNNLTNAGYIFQVHNGSEISVGITSSGDAEFNGVIKAKKGGTISGFNIGDTSIYNGTNSLTSTTSGVYLGTDGIRQYKSNEANVTISNGVLTANGANVSGEIKATSGTFSNCTIDNSCTIQGRLTIGNLPDEVATKSDILTSTSELTNDSGYQDESGVVTIINGTVTADFIKLLKLEVGEQIQMGANATIAWNKVDGADTNATNIAKSEISTATIRANQINVSDLNAFGATIGGWQIDRNSILSGNITQNQTISGMISANTNWYVSTENDSVPVQYQYQSLVDASNISPVRFIAGSIPTYYELQNEEPYFSLTDNINFMVLEDGSLYANAANIKGNIEATSGSFNGTVYANSGKIGGFTIENSGLISNAMSLTTSSAFFKTANFSLNNDVTIFNDDINEISYIATSGGRDFEVKNMGGAGIRFKADEISQQIKVDVTISYQLGDGISSSFDDIFLDYKISDSSTFITPYVTTIYIVYTYSWLYGGETVKRPIDVVIPAFSNYGRIQIEITYPSGSSTFDGIALSKTESPTNSVTFPYVSINNSNNILYSLGSFCPNVSADAGGTMMLGDGNRVWKSITAQSAIITTSDRNQKHNIKYISNEFEKFYDKLKPVSFVYNYNDSNRTHIGFIAQDIEDCLVQCNIDTKDFAGMCIDENKDTGEKKYFLRYEEFIPLNTIEIQKLKKRVEELENKLKELNY